MYNNVIDRSIGARRGLGGPGPDLPNGRPAFMQGAMGAGAFGASQHFGIDSIAAMNANDGGRRAALQRIYEYMRIYGPTLTDPQRKMIQAKARAIRGAFYADRNKNRIPQDAGGPFPEFNPSTGGYNPTPRAM